MLCSRLRAQKVSRQLGVADLEQTRQAREEAPGVSTEKDLDVSEEQEVALVATKPILQT